MLRIKVVRFCLLVVIIFHLDATPAFSWRGSDKNSVVRDGLRWFSSKHLTNLDRWAKAALYSGALLTLTFTSPVAVEALDRSDTAALEAQVSNEQATIIQRKETEEDISQTRIHTANWSITLTTRGKIAHMYTQTMEEGDSIRIAAYLEPTLKGKKYLAAKPLTFYHADKSYTVHNRPYNGFTLPLHLNWLASKHTKTIDEIHELLDIVATSERALVELGDSMYRSFSRLHVASADDYRFENLATQTEVKFAGRRFFEHHTVKEAIERRLSMLQTRMITYKQRRQDAHLDPEVLNQADAAYRTALDLLQESVAMPMELNLNFDADAADDIYFTALAKRLVYLKLARLLLAEKILALYQPFRMPFFYSAGVKEHLVITVYADDSEHRDIALRYKIRTTSTKHRKEFTLGQVDFDHNFNIKKMWLSLKPRGGLASRIAKLTFTPCIEKECPDPDFKEQK